VATRIHIYAILIFSSKEGTEKLFALLLWHPNPLVGHSDHDDSFFWILFFRIVVDCNSNKNFLALRRELDGITDEISNNLLDAVHVNFEHRERF